MLRRARQGTDKPLPPKKTGKQADKKMASG
jgi:hypothetical protein